MNKKEIADLLANIKDKDWYYYYNFGGLKVGKNLKNVKHLGMNNWNRIKSIISSKISTFENARVLDIGCNMGIITYEMSKLCSHTIGIDKDIEHAELFFKYIGEPKNLCFKKIDITKDVINDVAEVDIITMFCVIYHLGNNVDKIINSLPRHKIIIVQGNNDRIKKKQKLVSSTQIADFLNQLKYTNIEIFNISGYMKPIVVGVK